MALTIPKSIISASSQGEQRLFNILKTKLPEDFIIWYEPRLQHNFYPSSSFSTPESALWVLRCCSELEGQSVGVIATLTELHQESTRAILKALEGRLVAAEVTAGIKLWRLVR